MMKIDIYTKGYCPFCIEAKDFLHKKGLSFNEIDLIDRPDKRSEMIERAQGRTTVPQIFINQIHIGGCDDLHEANKNGLLDRILSAHD